MIVYLLMALNDDNVPYIVQHRTFWKTPKDAERWWNMGGHRVDDKTHWTQPITLPETAVLNWKIGNISKVAYAIAA